LGSGAKGARRWRSKMGGEKQEGGGGIKKKTSELKGAGDAVGAFAQSCTSFETVWRKGGVQKRLKSTKKKERDCLGDRIMPALGTPATVRMDTLGWTNQRKRVE